LLIGAQPVFSEVEEIFKTLTPIHDLDVNGAGRAQLKAAGATSPRTVSRQACKPTTMR